MLFKLLLALAPVLPELIPLFRQLLQQFSKDAQQRAEWDKKLVAQTKMYQAGVKDAVRVRDAHEALKVKAEEEWQKRWGTPPVVVPAPVGTGKLIAPEVCILGQEFTVRFENFPKGTKLFADHTWLLFTLGDVEFVSLTLTSAGMRTLDIQLPDGQWSLSANIKVVKASTP